MPEPPKRPTAEDGSDANTVTPRETISLEWRGAKRKSVSIPRAVGRVKIGDELGRGGMGIVFRGWDPVLHRTVAVKFLPGVSVQADSPQFAQFFGGARAEAAVRHPNIVTEFDVGQVEGAGAHEGVGRPDIILWKEIPRLRFKRIAPDTWRLTLDAGRWRTFWRGRYVKGVIHCDRRKAALIRNEIRRRLHDSRTSKQPGSRFHDPSP